MAHTSVSLDLAVGFASRSRWTANKPDYIPAWKLANTPRLEDARTRQLKEAFAAWDLDGNGSISRAELKQVMEQLQATPKDIDHLMDEADKDGNGNIDMCEFIDWLYGGQSSGAHLFDYGEAFMALFQAYDVSKSGTITYAEFEQCHCILQGALALNPVTDEEDRPMDIMGLNKDAAQAFAHADTLNRPMHFMEFERYMSKIIDPTSMQQEEFCEVAFKLANALKTVLKGVRQAEMGKIAEDQPEVLQAMILDLAETTREFDEALKKGIPDKQPQKWIDPPRGLTITTLKATHMQCMPVNMLLVDSFVFDVVCVPEVPSGKEDTNTRTWYAEVVRKVKSKSGVVRTEFPCFYTFDEESNAWLPLPQSQAAQFQTKLQALHPEMGLFCLMKVEADYGKELSWSGVKNALFAGTAIGWISAQDAKAYYQHMEEKAFKMVQQTRKDATPEDLEEAARSFLVSQLIQRPRVVMATLSKLGIVDINPLWKVFITSDL